VCTTTIKAFLKLTLAFFKGVPLGGALGAKWVLLSFILFWAFMGRVLLKLEAIVAYKYVYKFFQCYIHGVDSGVADINAGAQGLLCHSLGFAHNLDHMGVVFDFVHLLNLEPLVTFLHQGLDFLGWHLANGVVHLAAVNGSVCSFLGRVHKLEPGLLKPL
jgi:hypothetical protein